MKRFVEGAERSQGRLFAERLEDWISGDNAVRAGLCLSLGAGWDASGLVRTKATGEPVNQTTLTNGVARHVKDLKIPRVRFHDLGHVHATQLLKEAVDSKFARERLCHATVAVTLDLYSHVMPGMQEDAAARVDRALKTALAKRTGNEN